MVKDEAGLDQVTMLVHAEYPDAAVRLDVETGRLHFEFQVWTSTIEEAGLAMCRIVRSSLRGAGLDGDVESAEVQRMRVAAARVPAAATVAVPAIASAVMLHVLSAFVTAVPVFG